MYYLMSLFIFLSVNKYAGLQYRYLVLHSDTLWNYFSSQNAFDRFKVKT